MTTTIYPVRHGQTDSNIIECYMGRSMEDLNQVGHRQADLLAKRLAGNPIVAIYTSPIQRALSTADITAGPHYLTQNVLYDIAEMDLGEWEHVYRRLYVDNAPLTVIKTDRLRFRVISLNDTGHLDDNLI